MCHGMLHKNTDYLWFIVWNTWDNQWPPVTPNNGREVLRNGTGHGHQSSRSHQSVTSNIAWNTSPFEALKWANDTKMGRQLKHIFDSPAQDFPSISGYRTPYFCFCFSPGKQTWQVKKRCHMLGQERWTTIYRKTRFVIKFPLKWV